MCQLMDKSCFAEYLSYPDDARLIVGAITLLTGLKEGQSRGSAESDCDTLLLPESSSIGLSMLRWMKKKTECLSSFDAYESLPTPKFSPHT